MEGARVPVPEPRVAMKAELRGNRYDIDIGAVVIRISRSAALKDEPGITASIPGHERGAIAFLIKGTNPSECRANGSSGENSNA